MNTGEGQVRGALVNLFVEKKCPFCIFRMLPSVSKMNPDIFAHILQENLGYMSLVSVCCTIILWVKSDGN